MKVKIPCTKALVGILNGTDVIDVQEFNLVGNISAAFISKKYGKTCFKISKYHKTVEIPDDVVMNYVTTGDEQ